MKMDQFIMELKRLGGEKGYEVYCFSNDRDVLEIFYSNQEYVNFFTRMSYDGVGDDHASYIVDNLLRHATRYNGTGRLFQHLAKSGRNDHDYAPLVEMARKELL